MEKVIDFFPNIVVTTIILNLIVSFCIAVKLYSHAPEKEEMSFNKYWRALTWDASPGNDKNLLDYQGDGRFALYKAHRFISLALILIVGGCVALTFLLRNI